MTEPNVHWTDIAWFFIFHAIAICFAVGSIIYAVQHGDFVKFIGGSAIFIAMIHVFGKPPKVKE